jgi:hypothetical protein
VADDVNILEVLPHRHERFGSVFDYFGEAIERGVEAMPFPTQDLKHDATVVFRFKSSEGPASMTFEYVGVEMTDPDGRCWEVDLDGVIDVLKAEVVDPESPEVWYWTVTFRFFLMDRMRSLHEKCDEITIAYDALRTHFLQQPISDARVRLGVAILSDLSGEDDIPDRFQEAVADIAKWLANGDDASVGFDGLLDYTSRWSDRDLRFHK